MITLNGLGWQSNVQYQNRIGSEPPVADVLPFRPPVATSNTAQQQNNHGNASQQNAEDAREEAFAKLKVQLQNPDVSARQQGGVEKPERSSAEQAFHDYMAKSPAEKIKEKILAELGMTAEEYDALPPEKKELVDKQIAQKIKEEAELKAKANLDQQLDGSATPAQLMAQANGTQTIEQASKEAREKQENILG
ncbi:hypothetical protein ACYU03_18200 [Pseudomonas sp. X10]